MARARQRMHWDTASTTIANLATCLTGKEFAPWEFNPYRRDEAPGLDALKPENL